MEAANEIGLAVIATTFTLIAVFLPTAFMGGIAGKFFKQFGWTAALAVFASLVVARMLTPMMAAYMMKPDGRGASRTEVAGDLPCAGRRGACGTAGDAGGGGRVLVGSIMLDPAAADGFHPARRQFADTGLPRTGAWLDTRRHQGRSGEGAATGDGRAACEVGLHHHRRRRRGHRSVCAAGLAEVRKATLTILLTERLQRPERKQPIEANIRKALEQVPACAARSAWVAPARSTSWCSPATTQCHRHGRARWRKICAPFRNLGSITSTASLVRPRSRSPNIATAAELGVTSAAIAETLRIGTVGDYDQFPPS